MNTELKPGYKQTEVGVIPVDWEVKTVGEISEVKTGPFGSALHEKDYVADGTPIITVEHLGERGIYHSNLPMVSDADRARLKAYSIRNGDLVFSRVGSVDRNALVRPEEDGWLFSGRLLRVRLKSKDIDSHYLSFHFHSESFKQRVKDVAVGQTMASINTKILMGISAIIPPTKAEQEAIAEALCDTDALIESLEQLIAKKRHIKQGTMQELLTGKNRLPGFQNQKGFRRCELGLIPDDWHCRQLPSLTAQGAGSIKIGPFGSALKKEYLTKDGFKVYGQENVYENNMDIGERFINYEHYRKLRSCEIKTGDFLISMMGTVGKCMIVPTGIKDGIMDSHLLRLRLDSGKLNPSFLAQLFETKIVFDQVKQLSVGGIMEGLSSKIIKSLNLPVPSIEEQISIAEALSDMDAEIAALETRLAKTRSLKQGMMHNLLTGRIRLP
ncbi:MAG: restriction endonuclease subunit S [Methylococcaceae bacterium]